MNFHTTATSSNTLFRGVCATWTPSIQWSLGLRHSSKFPDLHRGKMSFSMVIVWLAEKIQQEGKNMLTDWIVFGFLRRWFKLHAFQEQKQWKKLRATLPALPGTSWEDSFWHSILRKKCGHATITYRRLYSHLLKEDAGSLDHPKWYGLFESPSTHPQWKEITSYSVCLAIGFVKT